MLIFFGFYSVLILDFILSNILYINNKIRFEFIFFSFLPIVSPTDSSSDEVFCEKVRENISRTMGIQLTQFDERDVDELKKRPEILQRRYGK